MSNTQGRYDDTEAGQKPWIRETFEKRSDADEYLRECAHEAINNWKSISPHPYVVALHGNILRYRDQLAVKADVSGDVEPFTDWDKRLTTIELPRSGRYSGGVTNEWGEYTGSVYDDADTVEKPVNLNTLSTEWGAQNEIDIVLELDGGRQVVEKHVSAYLPPAASRIAFNQLDRVLEDIGWTPDAAELEKDGDVLAPGGPYE